MTNPTAAGKSSACGYCGMIHSVRCPSVQAIEYHPDGSVKRVEFVKAAAMEPSLYEQIFGRGVIR